MQSVKVATKNVFHPDSQFCIKFGVIFSLFLILELSTIKEANNTNISKGQIKSKWIYEIINFSVGVLENWWFHTFILT